MTEPRGVLFGLPTAGKSTVAALAARSLGVPAVNVGQALRERATRACWDGSLAPDDEVIAVVRTGLAGAGGYVLDGFPRTMVQLAAFELDELADRCRYVLLDLPRELVRDRFARRLNCVPCRRADYADGDRAGRRCPRCGGPLVGRPDEGAEVLARKLAEWDSAELPVVESLARRGELVTVPVQGDADADLAPVLDALRGSR